MSSEMRSAEEILARRLDQVLPPDTTSLPPHTPDPLVNMAARFARIGVTEPSDAAFARMEAVVLAAFDRQYRLQRRQPHRWVAQVARWAVAACLIFALLAAGAVPASAGSLPGEPLYWVKLAAERVELALATTPESTALVHLNHAERRATEALTLLDRNQFDQTLLNTALTELRNAAQSAPAELASSRTYQWQQQQVSALVQYAAVQAEESGFDVPPIFDTLPTLDPPAVLVPDDETQTPTATASHTPSPTSTASSTASHTPTPTAPATATTTALYTPSTTATETAESTGSRTPSPTRTTTLTPPSTSVPTQTPVLPATMTPWPSEEPEAAIACPGNSCDSAGVPGGQIDPEAPPGQSGGRDDNPPDPPGQGDPGGGLDNNPGQGNSGDNSGGSSQGQPPSDSGGNSGNGQDNSGNSSGNSGNGQGNSGNGNSGNGQGN